MSQDSSIINLGNLAKPATVLIEKISNAIGTLYEPRSIIKKAIAEAEAEKIKVLAGIELNEIQQRGIERLIHQEARKQDNIESITTGAASRLPSNAKPEELDEDWVAHFFDKCDKVSDKQMQSLWSTLLAREATAPGKYSKRTVDYMASMDKEEAILFTKLCQFVWIIGEDLPAPLVFDIDNAHYAKYGINFSSLKHLDAIGLISFDPVYGYKKENLPKKILVFYFGKPFVFEFEKECNNEMLVGKVMFTQTGKELLNICVPKESESVLEYVKVELSKQNIIVSELELSEEQIF